MNFLESRDFLFLDLYFPLSLIEIWVHHVSVTIKPNDGHSVFTQGLFPASKLASSFILIDELSGTRIEESLLDFPPTLSN